MRVFLRNTLEASAFGLYGSCKMTEMLSIFPTMIFTVSNTSEGALELTASDLEKIYCPAAPVDVIV